MKSLMWRLYLMAALGGLTLGGAATTAFAQDERGGTGERLERLEKRVNEMAERQEQLMRRLGAQMELHRPMALPGGENIRRPMQPPGAPAMEPHNPPGARAAKGAHDILGLLFLIGILCNILNSFRNFHPPFIFSLGFSTIPKIVVFEFIGVSIFLLHICRMIINCFNF